jgi:hypothetical protein
MWLCRNRVPRTMVSTTSTSSTSRQQDPPLPPPVPFDEEFYNPSPRYCNCAERKETIQFVSWTPKNPLRRFTVCPLRLKNPVGSFGWLLHSFGWFIYDYRDSRLLLDSMNSVLIFLCRMPGANFMSGMTLKSPTLFRRKQF